MPPSDRCRFAAPAARRVGTVAVLTALLALASGTGLVGSTPPVAAATVAEDDAPISVTIRSMTPSVIPEQGPLRFSGVITNNSDETWTAINVSAFTSYFPMTTPGQLRVASATDPELEIGDRVTTQGTFDTIDELPAGQSASYSMRVPREELEISEDEGVYWVGVHALGTNSQGRDLVADGRARSFIPLVRAQRRTVTASLVVPIRAGVRHRADGSVGGVGRWARDLGPNGRLQKILDFAELSDGLPLTWLVDPAVLETVRSLTVGNPPRNLDPTVRREGGPAQSPTASPRASGEPTSAETPGDGAGPFSATSPAAEGAATNGQDWLDQLSGLVDGADVRALPYGDTDVAAVSLLRPELYQRARELGTSSLSALGIESTPAVAPPSGYLNPSAFGLLEEDNTLLLSDAALGDRYADQASAPSVLTSGRVSVGLTDAATSDGGPGPNPRLEPTALRQRLLAEAAVRVLGTTDEPLIVAMPADWDPSGDTSGFFEGLDVEWLRIVDLSAATDIVNEPVDAEEFVYPELQRQRELALGNLEAAEDLRASGETLQNLLTYNDTVSREVTAEALTSVSYSTRADQLTAELSIEESARWIARRTRLVRVDAPSFVTLSSASGNFSVTVTNELDQPVTVQLRTRGARQLRVPPPGTLALEAGTATTVLLDAEARELGVHPLRLVVTDQKGTPLGGTAEISVRSNQVGLVIWVILGIGAGILLIAIMVRLVRRVRGATA